MNIITGQLIHNTGNIHAKEELKRVLKAYKSTVVLVCHEPDFYEDCITKTRDVEAWSNNQN